MILSFKAHASFYCFTWFRTFDHHQKLINPVPSHSKIAGSSKPGKYAVNTRATADRMNVKVRISDSIIEKSVIGKNGCYSRQFILGNVNVYIPANHQRICVVWRVSNALCLNVAYTHSFDVAVIIPQNLHKGFI